MRARHICAAGSSEALRKSLRDFLNLKEAPTWFVDGMQHGETASSLATKALTIKLKFSKPVTMTVGQRLEYVGSDDKCRGEIAKLVSAEPEGCLVERHRRVTAGSRSGFYGGRTKDTAIFNAVMPGRATVEQLLRGGCGRPLAPHKVVEVKIKEASL